MPQKGQLALLVSPGARSPDVLDWKVILILGSPGEGLAPGLGGISFIGPQKN